MNYQSSASMLRDAFTYPFRGSGWIGWIVLLTGSVFSAILKIGGIAPMFGLIAQLMGGGYFLSFYFDIINRTATGDDESPSWPGLSDIVGDIIQPVGQFLVAIFLCGLPIIIGSALFRDGILSVMTSLVFWGWFVFCFPMAMLGIAVEQNWMAALPQRVLPAIRRCIPTYFVAVGILLMTFGMSVLSRKLLTAYSPVIGFFFAVAAGLYFAMVQCRILGLLYRQHPTVFLDDDDEEELHIDASAPAPVHSAPGVPPVPAVRAQTPVPPRPVVPIPPVPASQRPPIPPIPPVPPSQRPATGEAGSDEGVG